MWACVQFISEISNKRQCRIAFDPGEGCNGLKLFKSTAQILMFYGNCLVKLDVRFLFVLAIFLLLLCLIYVTLSHY
jgi:hypothetical protein